MTSFRFPGELTEVERQNLEGLVYTNPLQYLRIEFDFKVKGSIGILPKDAILDFNHLVFIEDAFDVPNMYISTRAIRADVMAVQQINSQGTPLIVIARDALNGKRLLNDTELFIVFDSTAPTKGRGWIIIKYILWPRL